MEDEQDLQEVSNPEGDEDTSTLQEEVAPEATDELKKAQELAKNYKIRAEKAEKEAKLLKKPEPEPLTPKTDDLSSTDLYALVQANVPQADIEEVSDYAKLKKISISEALNTSVVKTILNERAEERQTAEAANTATAKRPSSKSSDAELLNKLEKGELPEEDIEKAVKAKIAQMKKGT